ncbi:MAG: hypothetical protein K2M59_03910 [Muribaculaceae bacterium]|nr:hypothetical protein [Muribaculaceae bacterium]MDE7465556.1 hypothetical protein [Muribaculaceae bacterium]
MRKLRTCDTAQLYTGVSKCAPDFGKMRVAILVKPGTKLPEDLTADKLEKLAHASRNERIYGIVGLMEYAKNGGEVQTSATGYGPEQVTGVSARKDTFDLAKYYPELDSSLMNTANSEWDVYFIDEDNYIHGINDGSDSLAGYPMSSVYSESTPMPTSSARASMQVVFCHENAKLSKVAADYLPLGFKLNYKTTTLGLIGVKLQKTGDSGNDYKLFEVRGGYDVTPIYGPLIADAGSAVISGATSAATYNEDTQTLTIASAADADIRLKPASVLYENDIKGIEQIA